MSNVTTAARRVSRAYNAHAYMGGSLHVWADGSTQWLTTGSRFENPGADYLGALYLDSRERMTQARAQEWMDDH